MKSLKELLEEYDVELKSIGKNLYRGFCPFPDHNDAAGGKPQFTYYEISDSFFCFRDNIGGDAARFLSLMENISYAEAKSRIVGTDAEQLQELKDTIENLDIDISTSFNLQLNFQLRPKLRDLFYKYPKKTQDILNFMKELDTELKSKITFEKMNFLFEKFKQFQDKIVVENTKV